MREGVVRLLRGLRSRSSRRRRALVPIESPLRGRFFRGELEAVPFVRADDRVGAGGRIGLVDDGETRHELATPVGGRVALVLIQDGQPVVPGQAVLVLEADRA